MATSIGNWDRSLKTLLDSVLKSNAFRTFKNLLYDTDRIRFLQARVDLCKIDWVEKYFENCSELHRKSTEKAAALRLAGNKLFQKKQYRSAVEKYTEAIVQGPVKSNELALAFGNRSAAWFYLEDYKHAIQDIGQAIENGYPLTTQYKLTIRLAHCCFRLGNWKDASEAAEKVLKELEIDETLSEKRKDELETEVRDLKDKISHSRLNSRAIKEEEESHIPNVSHGHNCILVQASGAVNLMCNETQGRYLVANRDIHAGETLIVEKPYAAVLLPDHYVSHCHHCFMVLQNVYPCRQCTVVKYCSPVCEDQSWLSYHRIECSYLDLLHSVGIAHLSLRIILVAGLHFLLDFRRKIEALRDRDRIPGLTEEGKYERNYLTVYDLMTHTEDMAADDLYQYSLTALLLLKILRHSDWFDTYKPTEQDKTDNVKASFTENSDELIAEPSDSKDGYMTKSASERDTSCNCTKGSRVSDLYSSGDCEPDSNQSSLKGNSFAEVYQKGDKRMGDSDCKSYKCHSQSDELSEEMQKLVLGDVELYIGGLLLRHIQQLICNAHAITELQATPAGEGTLVEETSQVRVATAIYPTASLMNHSCDPTIISSFYKDTLIVRAVKGVKAGGEIFNCYGPHYKRMKRSERQQSLSEQYFFHCSCEPCSSSKEEEEVFSSYRCPGCSGPFCKTDHRLVCRECQYTSDGLQQLVKEAENASDLFSDGLFLLQRENYKDAITVITSCYKMRQKLLYKHNKELAETQDCLARCYAMSGQFKKASEFLQGSIETVRVIHGTESIELAHELRKLSEVLISAHEWKHALEVTKEAIMLFTMHYGKSHDSVKELCAAKSELLDLL